MPALTRWKPERAAEKSLTFSQLIQNLRKTLAEGRARAERAVDSERARTYWECGRRIHLYELHGRDRAKYGKGIITAVADKLRLSPALVYEMVKLYRRQPNFQALRKSAWTDQLLLSYVKDSKRRQAIEKKASKENWSFRRLKSEIEKLSPQIVDRASTNGKKFKPLIPRRGNFFTYRIVKPRDLHRQPAFYSIDLGFRQRHDLKLTGIKNPREGEVIAAVRTLESLSGDRYRLKRVDTPNAAKLLYTYKAAVVSVHDDDTLWAHVDFGFRFWSEVKLRLRGIDAAEIEKGKKASDFVKRTLARVPFVVISVSGRDKFGRPLTDLFYLEGTDDREKVLREGIFLNQQLLDLGLAKRI